MRLVGLVLLVLISFTTQAADPQWIYGSAQSEYQADKYLTAVGEGETTEDARKNAIARLAEQLKVSISSQSNITKEYKSTSEDSSMQENMDIQISTEVNLDNVEGIKIADQYFQESSKTYFAFAVLDKVKNATNLAFNIESQMETIRSQQKKVKDVLAKGNGSEGIIILLKTSHLFKKLIEDIELHKLFSGTGMNSMLKEDALTLVSDFDQYLAKVFRQVNVKVLSGAQKKGSPELGVSEPYQLIYTYNGQPLKRVPVSVVSQNEGMILEFDTMTNLRGELSVKVGSFPYSEKSENKIKAGLDLYNELFINNSPFAELVVLLSQKSKVTILLNSRISNRFNEYLYLTANDGYSSVLSEQNYNVISDQPSDSSADYIVDVKASASEMPVFNGIYFVKMNGVIVIKSAKTKRVLKTIRIKPEKTKAGALSSEMAVEKAVGLLVDATKADLLKVLENNLGRN